MVSLVSKNFISDVQLLQKHPKVTKSLDDVQLTPPRQLILADLPVSLVAIVGYHCFNEVDGKDVQCLKLIL